MTASRRMRRVGCPRRKPMARNTPISWVRSLSEPIIVMNTTSASMAMTTPTIAQLKLRAVFHPDRFGVVSACDGEARGGP